MDYVQINANTEEGFQDLEFSIVDYFQDKCGNHIVKAMGAYQDDILGFQASFRPDMLPGIIDNSFNNNAFCKEGISLYSIGVESDRFVQVLTKLYNEKIKKMNMVEELKFTSIALGGNPENFVTEDLKFKLFYDDYLEKGLYAELYVNVNISKGIIEFNEKDTGYRANICRALVGDYPTTLERIYKRVLKKV